MARNDFRSICVCVRPDPCMVLKPISRILLGHHLEPSPASITHNEYMWARWRERKFHSIACSQRRSTYRASQSRLHYLLCIVARNKVQKGYL